MTDVLAELAAYRIVPVVVLDDPSVAGDLGRALVDGGLPIAEVTLRTPAGIAAIAALASSGTVLVGAGTVTSVRQVDAAVTAGARFVVSPGCDPAVVRRCHEHGVVCLPGVATPTELMLALGLGCTTVKLFPAETVGGLGMVRALAGPFPEVRFVPTGGITAALAPAYLADPAVLAIGGSWMVPRPAMAEGRIEEIVALITQAAALGRTASAD